VVEVERKGQVSIELLIIIAAVLAVALILVVQLQKTASRGSEALEKESESAIGEIGAMIRCDTNEDCPSDFVCNVEMKKCEALK